MKKIISIFTVFIFIIALSGCGQKDLQSSDTVSNSITSDQHKDSRDISDNELIDLAIDISKEENNYTYWLFSAPVTEDESDIIQEEYSYTLNGEKFSEVREYVPVSEYESIRDFTEKASGYLSQRYIENYLYQYLGLHSTDNTPVPILKEIDGRLYKLTSVNGTSIIPNIIYTSGEVIQRDETQATVRLFADPDKGYDVSYFDYPLVLEDGVWKHNPSC